MKNLPPAIVLGTLERVTRSFNAHDADAYGRNFADDAVAITYGTPEFEGRQAVTQAVAAFLPVWADVKGGAATVWAKGNLVVVDWVSAGHMTADFFDLKATGLPLGGHRLYVTRLDDAGLVKELHEYLDMPGMMAQMKGDPRAPRVPTVPDTTAFYWAHDTPDEDASLGWLEHFNHILCEHDASALSRLLAPETVLTFHAFGGDTITGTAQTDLVLDRLSLGGLRRSRIANAWGIGDFAIVERILTMDGARGSYEEHASHSCEIFQLAAGRTIGRGWAFGNLGETSSQPPPTSDGASVA